VGCYSRYGYQPKPSSRALVEGVAIQKDIEKMDCHVASAPRNDDWGRAKSSHTYLDVALNRRKNL